MDNTTSEHLVVGHLCQVVDALHIITGPNGMCMCGRDGMTCGQILAMHSKDIQDARIMAEMKQRVGAEWVGADAVELESASENAERVRCGALLGELGAALSLLNKTLERPAHEWSDRTNFEFIVDVIRDLEDIVATERCHSPNEKLSDGLGETL